MDCENCPYQDECFGSCREDDEWEDGPDYL